MRNLVTVILIFIYTAGLSVFSSTAAFGAVVKLQITHSHSHGPNHVHSDVATGDIHSAFDSNSEQSKSDTVTVEDGSTSHPAHNGAHTHEIQIAGLGSIVVFPRGPMVLNSEITENCQFANGRMLFANDPHLFSIFRPPIA